MATVMQLEALPKTCDVAVIGAGVAGCMAALHLSRAGFDVVLIERARWPRHKVCGGCLNSAALDELERAGLNDAIAQSPRFDRMHLANKHRSARFALPQGRAITRRLFDARLAEAALASGVRFISETHANLDAPSDDAWQMILRSTDWTTTLNASIVLNCSGLSGRLQETVGCEVEVAEHAYIGIGTVLDDGPEFYTSGTIYMACARHGYVGLVRGDNDTLNIGAAFDPAWLKRCGGPRSGIRKILLATGMATFDGLDETRWRGTPRLTRRRRNLGAHRLFTLGDAAGYVEPFTGEGMAWALADAAAIQPFVEAGLEFWRDELVTQWTRRHNRLVGRRQRLCRALTRGLRHPRLLSANLAVAAVAPGLPRAISARLNRRFNLDASTTP
jgi:flavin-dependent dehydrogenase